MKDYYGSLGLDKSATPQQIKRKYRQLAMMYHPDKNKDAQAEQKFKEISQAYEILSNPDKRSQYDTRGYSPYDDHSFNFNGFNPGDIFADIFGGMFNGFSRTHMHTSNQPRQQHNTKNYQVKVDIRSLFMGATINVQNIPVYVLCGHCEGLGSKNKDNPDKICQSCNGSGVTTIIQKVGPMTIQQQVGCAKCKQSGRIITDPCDVCSGNKYIVEQKDIHLKIPKQCPNNASMVLYQDNLNTIYAQVVCDPEQWGYKIDGRHIIKYLDINIKQAIIGDTIPLSYINDEVIDIVIPQGSKDKSIIQMKDLGLSYYDQSGSLFIILNVKIPKYNDLSVQDKQHISKLNLESNI